MNTKHDANHGHRNTLRHTYSKDGNPQCENLELQTAVTTGAATFYGTQLPPSDRFLTIRSSYVSSTRNEGQNGRDL